MGVAKDQGDDGAEGVKVMVSREQPFARELRLSLSASAEGGSGNGKVGERRRGKVFKRHRLGREKSFGSVGVKELEVDVDVEMGEDGDEPALSPSLSSSESEDAGSRSPEVRGMELIDVAIAVGMIGNGFGRGGDEVKQGVERRAGISISDLLS